MLKVILKYTFIALGRCLVYLGYGRKGMEAREELGKDDSGTAFLLALALFFWIFSLFFLSIGPDIFTIIMVSAIPLGCAVWFFCARKSSVKQIEEAEKIRNTNSYAEIENVISKTVRDFCIKHTGDREILKNYLSEIVEQGVVFPKYAKILLNHFAPLDASFTYEEIEKRISPAVKDVCRTYAGNKRALTRELKNYIEIGKINSDEAEILLEHFSSVGNG